MIPPYFEKEFDINVPEPLYRISELEESVFDVNTILITPPRDFA